MPNHSTASISPWISVADAGAAVSFYTRAFGAVEREVLTDGDGRTMVAQLALSGADFWVQDDPGVPEAPGGATRRP